MAMTYHIGYMSKDKELIPIVEWCKTHCKSFAFNSFHVADNNVVRFSFLFKDEADLILFNLTWM